MKMFNDWETVLLMSGRLLDNVIKLSEIEYGIVSSLFVKLKPFWELAVIIICVDLSKPAEISKFVVSVENEISDGIVIVYPDVSVVWLLIASAFTISTSPQAIDPKTKKPHNVINFFMFYISSQIPPYCYIEPQFESKQFLSISMDKHKQNPCNTIKIHVNSSEKTSRSPRIFIQIKTLLCKVCKWIGSKGKEQEKCLFLGFTSA